MKFYIVIDADKTIDIPDEIAKDTTGDFEDGIDWDAVYEYADKWVDDNLGEYACVSDKYPIEVVSDDN